MKQLIISTTIAMTSVLLFSCSQGGTMPGPVNPGGGGGTVSYLPVVITTDLSYVTQTMAETGGTIISGLPVTSCGVCWSTLQNPTIANNKTTDLFQNTFFKSSLNNLIPGTTYYVRAYAINSVGIGYGEQKSFTTCPASAFTIGQYYQGGTIFYIDCSGIHGLIAAPADISSADIKWNNGTNITTNAISNTDGNDNTLKIIAAQIDSGSYAARACKLYNANGFSDWFLPAKDQLYFLYKKKSVVAGLNSSRSYWSSTENSNSTAWIISMPDGSQNMQDKSEREFVRPIRAF